MTTTPDIRGFQGPYRWLSNFWVAPISLHDITFPTAEHAYQAAKSMDPDDWDMMAALSTPGKAKRVGRSLTIRPDWDLVKLEAMTQITRLKYLNQDVRAKLLATGDSLIIEENSWGDTFWGVCSKTGRGTNHLGCIIMQVRNEINQGEI